MPGKAGSLEPCRAWAKTKRAFPTKTVLLGEPLFALFKKIGGVEDDVQVEEGRSFIYLGLAKVSSFSAK
ncbi:hypothetical protein BK140_20515 [Paenibacillus macerans]|nr:hypothetical protein BK140_20515 [Paenibacillus macerans]